MNAVIYARYSSDNQREESLEEQIKANTEYAEKNNINIIRIYSDKELTGTNDRRPDFQRMIDDSRSHFFELVLIHKTDRFARNKADSAIYKRILLEQGVKVIPVAEAFIVGNPFGVVMEGMLEGWAEYYSLNLSTEVKKGQNANISKFDKIGKIKHNGGKPPFGYDVDSEGFYVINKLEAIAVKKIFEMYHNGQVYHDVIDWLNHNGYTTKYKQQFTKSSLNSILHNVKYIGLYTYRNKKRIFKDGCYQDIDNPDRVEIVGGIPSILDESLFYEVQSIMKNNQANSQTFKAKHDYILSGKVFCSCGSSMHGNSYVGGRNKHQYVQYICSGRKKHINDCTQKPIDKDTLENNVYDQLQQSLFTDKKIDYICDQVYKAYLAHKSENTDSINVYTSKLESLNRQIANVVDAIASGTKFQSLHDKLSDLEHQKQIITFEIKREKVRSKNELTKEKIRDMLLIGQDLKNKTDKEKTMIINAFVDEIIVSDETIAVHVVVDMATEYGGEGN